MASRPLVSLIVLPEPRFPREVLEHVLLQDYRPIEVIWVGHLPAIPEDVPGHVVEPAATAGQSLGRGLEKASGEYVAFLEGAVLLEPSHLSFLVACLEESGGALAFSGAERCRWTFDPAARRFANDGCVRLPPVRGWLPSLLEGGDILPRALIRRKLAEETGFDASLDRLSGWDMALAMMRRTPFHPIPEVTVKLVEREEAPFPEGEFARVMEKHRPFMEAPDILGYRRLVEERGRDLRRALRSEEDARRRSREWAEIKKVLPRLQGEHLRAQRLEQMTQTLRHQRDILEQELTAIKSSRAWRYVQCYGRMRALLREPGRWHHRWRALKDEGLVVVGRRLKRMVPAGERALPRHDFPRVDERAVSLEAVDQPLTTPVSVIIPTCDAGDAFPQLLKRLRSQWGIASLEIVVIDSGSKDKTVAHARALADQVIEIPPEDFHHGRTRMLGAERAQGDVLVFTVQDALPAGRDWMHRLVGPIAEGDADAVSALQIPPSGADLFACWSVWGMRRHLGIEGNWLRAGEGDWKRQDKMALRRFIHLDSVGLAIPKALLLEHPFEGAYAEDLRLGWRLLEGGHRLLFQTDNAVIHAHTRPPAYFFRRAYVDHRALAGVLGIPEGRREPADVLATAGWAYRRFSAVLKQWEGWDKGGLMALADALRVTMRAGQEARGDEGLAGIFDAFPRHAPPFSLLVLFERTLYGHLYSLAEYLGCVREREAREVRLALHKLFAAAAGGFLADLGAELEPSILGRI